MAIKSSDLPENVQRRIAAQEKRKSDTREYLRTSAPSAQQKGTYRLERDLIKDVLIILDGVGIYAWRNNSGAAGAGKGFVRFGLKGSADIIGLLPPSGKFLAIECKARRGKPTLAQEEFLERIRADGGVAAVCPPAKPEKPKVRLEVIQMRDSKWGIDITVCNAGVSFGLYDSSDDALTARHNFAWILELAGIDVEVVN